MNQLYFDTECCDGYHICSFGYVLVDENFNILEEKDIVINPEKHFNLGRSGHRNIELAYSDKTIMRQPNFEYFYNDIKSLLMKENQIVLGHSVKSDLIFLKTACKRYDLPEIKIEAIDTQNLYFQYKKEKVNMALDKIADALEIKIEDLTLHKSSDDAKLSMLIAKKLCEKMNVSIQGLISICDDNCKVHNDLTKKELKEKLKKLFAQYLGEKEIICFSEKIKTPLNQNFYNLVHLIYKMGFGYTPNCSHCNYFVTEENSGKRYESCIYEINQNKKSIKIINLAELSKMLEIENDVNILELESDYVENHGKLDKTSKMYLAMMQAFDEKLKN